MRLIISVTIIVITNVSYQTSVGGDVPDAPGRHKLTFTMYQVSLHLPWAVDSAFVSSAALETVDNIILEKKLFVDHPYIYYTSGLIGDSVVPAISSSINTAFWAYQKYFLFDENHLEQISHMNMIYDEGNIGTTLLEILNQ